MLGFHGRFAGKQYMPKNPVKWGIKAFSLADSSNGYLFNVLLYSGAETLDEANPLFSTLPQPARVVIHLLEPYLHRGHHVFTARYYSSIPLAKTFHDNQTAFTGTSVRDRMDLPDQIRAGQTPKGGEVMAFRSNRLMALSWLAPKKKVSCCDAQYRVLSTDGHSTSSTFPGGRAGETIGSAHLQPAHEWC